MFKGFLRLAVILSVVAWVPISLFIIKDANKSLDMWINPHLGHPFDYSLGPSATDWCVVAASSAFLEKPEAEKLAHAEYFFRENIEWVTSETFINTERFRERFLKTAPRH
jgi:hypothetical protein